MHYTLCACSKGAEFTFSSYMDVIKPSSSAWFSRGRYDRPGKRAFGKRNVKQIAQAGRLPVASSVLPLATNALRADDHGFPGILQRLRAPRQSLHGDRPDG